MAQKHIMMKIQPMQGVLLLEIKLCGYMYHKHSGRMKSIMDCKSINEISTPTLHV